MSRKALAALVAVFFFSSPAIAETEGPSAPAAPAKLAPDVGHRLSDEFTMSALRLANGPDATETFAILDPASAARRFVASLHARIGIAHLRNAHLSDPTESRLSISGQRLQLHPVAAPSLSDGERERSVLIRLRLPF